MLRQVVAAALVLFFVGSSLAQDRVRPRYRVAESTDRFVSGDAHIQAVRFEPIGASGKRPAVLMLHGSDGWEQMKAYRFVGNDLAAQGHVAILIRYYDRTGTPDEISPEQRGEFLRWLNGKAIKEKDHPARRYFEEWIDTVSDAAAYARGLKHVDERRIGLVGFSLGGYLAVAAAAREHLRITALVEMFGGVPVEYRNKVRTLPPSLIVHGEEDDIVPVREADALIGLLTQKKQRFEAEIYPQVGHVFLIPGTDLPNPVLMLAGRDRMTAFFNKHLFAPLHESLKPR